jgi:meso-butanediol dehydrogenase / (S,S)-butanediol dehydrogenase / diacetyl reductase
VRLEGKVALVTGGTRGIGRGTVEMFAREGAAVGFTGRSEDTGLDVERAVRDAGGRATFIRADNGSEEQIAGAVDATVSAFGDVTTLVNNAISNDDVGSGRDSHVDVMDNETFDTIMTVALKGAFWCSKYCIPHMRRAGNGSIVNISASSSKLALPGRPAYQSSKGAINALTRQMAVDYGKENIRVNAIIVGFIFTGSPEMIAMLANPEYRAAFEKNVLTPRLGEPADIAAGATYLASDEAGYVTGTQLTIDGGAVCHQPVPELDFEALRDSAPAGSS